MLLGEVKNRVFARSSREAEFRALPHGVCEAIWIRRLLEELKFTQTMCMHIYCDNKAAISIVHNTVLHDKTKHIEVDSERVTAVLEAKLK